MTGKQVKNVYVENRFCTTAFFKRGIAAWVCSVKPNSGENLSTLLFNLQADFHRACSAVKNLERLPSRARRRSSVLCTGQKNLLVQEGRS